MLKSFVEYLVSKGYREYTPSGNPSTAYDYSKRVKKVCEREKCSLKELSDNIDDIIDKYDVGGKEEAFGRRSNSAFINALKRFKEFLEEERQ